MPLDILGTVRYTPELILKDLKSTRAMRYKVESQFMNSITEKELWLSAFPELFFFFFYPTSESFSFKYKTSFEASLTVYWKL